MTKRETRKQLSYSQLGTGISQENGGLNQVLRRVKPPTYMTLVNLPPPPPEKDVGVGSFFRYSGIVRLFKFGNSGYRNSSFKFLEVGIAFFFIKEFGISSFSVRDFELSPPHIPRFFYMPTPDTL